MLPSIFGRRSHTRAVRHEFDWRIDTPGRGVFQDSKISARLLNQLVKYTETGILAHANLERIEAWENRLPKAFRYFVSEKPGDDVHVPPGGKLCMSLG